MLFYEVLHLTEKKEVFYMLKFVCAFSRIIKTAPYQDNICKILLLVLHKLVTRFQIYDLYCI